MRNPILHLWLLFITISLLFPYTLHADSILEDQIYKYVSIVYIDPPMTPKDEAGRQNYENGLLAPIKAKTPEAIPILFKVLEDSSTQQVWIKRLEKEECPFAKFNILSRTMYTIPQLSTDTAIMDRLYHDIETFLITGKTYDDFHVIYSGIYALGQDSSTAGFQRLIALRQNLDNGKYPMQNLENNPSLKGFKDVDSSGTISKYFSHLIDKKIQAISDKDYNQIQTYNTKTTGNALTEEKVYQFLSCLQMGKFEGSVHAYLNSDSIPILFKFLEDTSVQNNWIDRARNDAQKERIERSSRAGMVIHAMHAIPYLSTDTEVMTHLYQYITNLIVNGKGKRDFVIISNGIGALAHDTSEAGITRLNQLRLDLKGNIYGLENLVEKTPSARMVPTDTPEQIRTYLIYRIDESIQLNLKKGQSKKPKVYVMP
ncbi:MAG: hypothetical protein ACE14V_03230 [bacterium]